MASRAQHNRGVFWEAFIKASGWASTLIVLLIIFFLFREGLSLFWQQPIEEGYVVGVHTQNPLHELDAEVLHSIQDGEATNWRTLGGPDLDIELLSLNNLEKMMKARDLLAGQSPEEVLGERLQGLPVLLDSLLQTNPGLLLAFPAQFMPASAKQVQLSDVSPGDFLLGGEWNPTEKPSPYFGIWPLLWGTLLVTLGAIVVALLLGPPVAIYLAELADSRVRGFLKPVIELLAGIPSVVFGFLGLVVLVPVIRELFSLDSGSTALAGSLLLAIIALPTIISVSEDALRSCPRDQKEAALALGATHWQTIKSVVVPYARPGILAALILGIGRIVGETMVVLMVTGNNPQLVGFDFLESVRTMSAAIAAEMGEAPQGGLHYKALFAVGGLLFLLTFAINFVGEVIKQRQTT